MAQEETMKDYEKELAHSFQILKEGDILDVLIIGISETEATVDLNYYTEGIIPLAECSNDPAFSIKNDLNIGDTVKAMVIDSENASGNVILSMREANDILVWDELKKDFQNQTVFRVKITEAVPAGVTGYVKGIRAFIPASQIALEYVEDTDSYIGMTLEAVIITVEPKEKRLVLSSKMIARERAVVEKTKKIGRLNEGDIVEGDIERIESYGVFINIGEGLTGLCHISQITNRFIKSPKEIVKSGEHVRAKILKIEGDRISLSIKALLEDAPEETESSYEVPEKYRNDAGESHDESPFAKLLQGIKL